MPIEDFFLRRARYNWRDFPHPVPSLLTARIERKISPEFPASSRPISGRELSGAEAVGSTLELWMIKGILNEISLFCNE